MVVCLCAGVTEREVEEVRDQGAATIEQLTRMCGAGSGCGGCWETLRHILAGCCVGCAAFRECAKRSFGAQAMVITEPRGGAFSEAKGPEGDRDLE